MWLNIGIAIVSVLVFLGGFGFAALAASDPEGRGGGMVAIGLPIALLGIIGFLYAVGSLIWHAFH